MEAELVDTTIYPSLAVALKKSTSFNPVVWLLDASSLNGCDQIELQESAKFIANANATVLVLANDSQTETSRTVRLLTGGNVNGVSAKSIARQVNFPDATHRLAGELTNQTFERYAKPSLTLDVPGEMLTTIITKVDSSACFVVFQLGKAKVFVWSTECVFDVHRRLNVEKEFESASDEYIPEIIFLRAAFGDFCWHTKTPGAGIVIDDPLLRKKYGFIDFQKLLFSARRHGYHITLAFIPWNYWRSSRKEAQFFLRHSDCFSVCAHGCDHTRNEFGSPDYDELLGKNFIAKRRMDEHSNRTGIRCEPLMVCPQEQYSLQAIRAFSDGRQFLCLVNTGCMPRNLQTKEITGADLLLPAQDSFFGFPVFKRHYWTGSGEFAMALFLGKPAILVEHHEFFRNGPTGAEGFVQHVASLRSDLRWASLLETVTRAHQRRLVSDGRQEVRFFTDAFTLEHDSNTKIEYRLFRRISERSTVRRVLVNGKDVQYTRRDGFLAFETICDNPQAVSVRVEIDPIKPSKLYSTGLRYQASVACRRVLSEFRDNVIAKNKLALRAGRFMMKSLKQTVS